MFLLLPPSTFLAQALIPTALLSPSLPPPLYLLLMSQLVYRHRLLLRILLMPCYMTRLAHHHRIATMPPSLLLTVPTMLVQCLLPPPLDTTALGPRLWRNCNITAERMDTKQFLGTPLPQAHDHCRQHCSCLVQKKNLKSFNVLPLSSLTGRIDAHD
jgi:hypothetical protein